MSFNDYDYALKFRNVVKQICTAEVDKIRPRIQYATVNTIDRTNRKCTVTFPGDVQPVPVNMGAIQPAFVGQVVRINGVMGDRFIEDVMGAVYMPGTAWTAPTLVNSWVNYGAGFDTAGYRIMADGTVMIKGLIKLGSSTVPAFTLPAGYRPSQQQVFTCYAFSGTCRLDVAITGTVAVSAYVSPATNSYVSLNGVRFWVT